MQKSLAFGNIRMNPSRKERAVNSQNRSMIAELGTPFLAGVLIDISSGLLKRVTHYISTSIYSDISLKVYSELLALDFWIGVMFSIGLVALSLWILERWPRAHPIRAVRIGVVILAVIIAGIVDPIGRAFRGDILAAYDKAKVGESMFDVLSRFQYHGDVFIEPNKDNKRHGELDCIGGCWLRLLYDVPVIFGERSITLEFGRDQKLIRKCDINFKCAP